MNSQPHTRSSNTLSDAHGTWLISFADLLTLLLCAFLMMFSLNWDKQQHVPKVSKDNINATETESHGIVIADSVQETKEVKALEQRIEVRFSKDDFEADGITFTRIARERIRKLVVSDGYHDAAVSLALCRGAQGLEVGSTRLSGLLRIAGQLLDAGVTEQRLRFEVIGSSCAAMTSQSGNNSENVTQALLIFERVG